MRRFILVLILVAGIARGDLTLPRIFGDHMVLQRDMPVAVWGTADAGAKVLVSLGEALVQTQADAAGDWSAQLPGRPAGGPHTLTVSSGGNTVEFTDVMIGEVWICSGQSNMQWGLRSTTNGEAAIAAADLPDLRLFQINANPQPLPLEDLATGSWRVSRPDNVGGFTAVGFYFGRTVQADLAIPVGLIQTAVGGTRAESWTRLSELEALAAKGETPTVARLIQERAELLPRLDELEAGHAAARQAHARSVRRLYELEADQTPAKRLADPELDDRDWPTMKLPANWEERGHRTLDGIVWFRLTIDVPAALAGKDAILKPGPIDEVDQTWFNGRRIGGKGNMKKRDTQFWNVPREYPIPADLLREGRNVIAIRVFDMAGQGGLWGGPAAEMKLVAADGTGPGVPLAGEWRYKITHEVAPRPRAPLHSNVASSLWNGMVAPFVPYTSRGAIWYQGESNSGQPDEYAALLSTMIRDWRAQFDREDLPFGIVQLANFLAAQTDPGQDPGWAALRQAQTEVTQALPNVGLAVTIDIGEAKDIHPRNKLDVGRRLAAWALATVYGRDIVYSGPVFREMAVADGKAVLHFDHVGSGLVLREGERAGFAIRGADGTWHWADAEVADRTVVVSNPEVPEPVAVRYAWAHNPPARLYNKDGFPAVPFSTE